ncbi:unnamed protein product [Camellia sinensis]
MPASTVIFHGVRWIKAANGVDIATEKKLPSILVAEASIQLSSSVPTIANCSEVQKIQILTPNIGVVYSGMGPDSRVLVRKSRKQAEQYHRLYKRTNSCQLVRETAAVMQEFTQSSGVRPFAVSLLVAGFDDKGPQLYELGYSVDPSGSYFSWKASAMGKNVSNAKTFLEKSGSAASSLPVCLLLFLQRTTIEVGDHPVNKILVDTAGGPEANQLCDAWIQRGASGAHGELLKFHLDTVIAAIRGDQRATKECCMIEVKAKEKAKKIVAASGIVAASSITDGCMRSDSGPMAVFNFAKFSEEAETDAKIGGDDSSVAAVEKAGASYRYTDDMELNDAVHTAILTLKEGFEGQISEKNIEIGIIGTDKKFRVLTPSEIADYLEEVE